MGSQSVEMNTQDRPRILFLDAYDSFTNNITSLLTTLLDVDVYVLPIDAPLSPAELEIEVARYDAVVCGPGPGSPEAGKDVGLMRLVWDLDLPVLGVCLGFQSLVVACGGRVKRLRRGLHGMVREVKHLDNDVFRGVGGFKATLYHSLGVTADGYGGFRLPELEQLAWVEEERDDGAKDTILMAVKHRTKPYWGLQYHPESVCTEVEGNRVIKNWFELAMRWNQERGRVVHHGLDRVARKATRESLLSRVPSGELNELDQRWWSGNSSVSGFFQSSTLPLPSHVQVPDIVELLDGHTSEHIVLDSANAMLPAPAMGAADVRGRYSIIGLDLATAVRVSYMTGDEYVTVRLPVDGHDLHGKAERVNLERYGGIWNFLADYQDRRRVDSRDGGDTPFLGGFMGFVTYEQGLSDIGVEIPADRGHRRPDVCLVWVTRSVVVDHREGLVHVQELGGGSDSPWIQRTVTRLQRSWVCEPCSDAVDVTETQDGVRPCPLTEKSIRLPIATEYKAKVSECQDYIAAGDSYELCLTDQTTITRPRSLSLTLLDSAPQVKPSETRRLSSTKSTPLPSSWQLFRKLRTRQPAPFASYLRLGPATLVSASPERFLAYDRVGHVSMRPMKGTVRKSAEVSSLAQAEAILHVPKEEAENLMIVDLVRHDLHGVCGAGNVEVKELMKVEEYESVFQMITVVEGQLPSSGGYTGLDVLAASLPPGSMTGAPKKRSCEILRELEGGQERGLYSGVVGYMCASGRGDWSVTIRSLFRWDDEGGEGEEVWRIGAGGAVTILSTPEGEAEEMFTKLAGPLGVFKDSTWS
ncbi:para-aminobenzoate synthase-like protein [Coniochaeta ligniaria NRRL 30616]|uniref:aminodeoxychorismate synthase n=1 Tax=Coniochaeta ligniaria NRRL 30616 TaxID=1408157 RepID=A0A1J7IPN4_9PEZI|nr:para-aminobenzoate synthase-like protein [Coniochaeta ligniaria NRRL 30616]